MKLNEVSYIKSIRFLKIKSENLDRINLTQIKEIITNIND
jgi:hypothetical protein